MSAKTDDLEAVRLLADTLEPFTSEDRERIIRWARERLGMATPLARSNSQQVESSLGGTAERFPLATAAIGSSDIKSFVTQKAPKSDVHFAATVAYYHQFMAPTGQRKDSITKDDLVEACRQVPRKRPKRPAQVLVNAYQDGLLDRGGTGHYKLNSVGENLVAMVLPGKADASKGAKKRAAGGRRKGSHKKKRARKGR